MAPPKYQPHLTSAENVILGLRAAITSGELPPGAQIRQEELAAQYSVSRMPVREALRQLEAEGLVAVYPGRGAFVSRLSAAEIQEIYDIRILLEGDAMRRAFPNLTPLTLAEADILLAKLKTSSDGDTYGPLDAAFHTTLYAPSDRPRLLNMISTLRNQVTNFLYAASPIESYRDSANVDHQAIMDACHASDVEAAVVAVQNHLRNSVQMVIDLNQ